MKFKRSLKEDEEFAPMSSVADITFLLIIFFMVATVFNVEKGINMQLPDTVVQEEIPTENVTVSIDNQGEIFLDGEGIELETIGRRVKEVLQGHPERFVLIKSDKGIEYGKVVDILDELFQAGIHNIALPTKKEIIGESPSGEP